MNSSYKKYFDPAQVESDQKDLIISQLKAELFELRRNEKNYEELHAKLNNLEHRYNLLQEEKLMNERDYKNRQEVNSRTISNLKQDIDSLRNEYESASSDIHALRLENNGVNDIINSRNAEVQRLKIELTEVFEENNHLELEKRDLQTSVSKLRDENRQHSVKLDDSTQTASELTEKKARLEKYLKDLEYDRNRQEKQQIELTKNQDQLRLDIKNKNEAVRFAETTLNDNKKHILALESDISDLKRTNEKTKNEIQQAQKNQSAEFNQNLEAQQIINKLEDTIKLRDSETSELKGTYDGVKREHISLLNSNEDLQHDIEHSSKHLDLLNAQNNELMVEIERYNEQDERVRAMLDRKERVQDVKQKTEGKMKQSYYSMSASLRSPTKRKTNQD